MRSLLLWIAFVLMVLPQPIMASEIYRNPEYSFSVRLVGSEKICSRDAHGVTVAFAPEQCGRADAYIAAMFNGSLDEEFPSKAEQKVCGHAPILRAGVRLNGSEWLYCMLSSSPKAEIYYFNHVSRETKSAAPWMFLDIDAKFPFQDAESFEEKIKALMQRISVDNQN